ncbi:MAG: hypothetical protein ACLSHU_05020 [Oscillospiraceae bacterium]
MLESADGGNPRLKAKLQGRGAKPPVGGCLTPCGRPAKQGAERLTCPSTGGAPAAGIALRVQFQRQLAGTELGPMGADAAALYMSANVEGEALKPMNKARLRRQASMARIMLALTNVSAQQDQVWPR